jgi:cation:H+ antiporter
MLDYILLIVGIALLYYAGNYLVDGSSSLAKKFGISSLVIGLTVVAFGTSAPELIVNVLAALSGSSAVAFGNIIGSNMANILIILGLSATLLPLHVTKSTVKKEIPFALFGAILLMLLTLNIVVLGASDTLTRLDGLVLLIGFGVFLFYIYRLIQKGKKDKKLAEEVAGDIEVKKLSTPLIWTYIIGGLIGLFIGGKLTVDSAVRIAQSMGISEFFISVTIIAVGTSLPELITSVIAAAKKEMDLSVGNIVGSNIFNIFFIMGIASVVKPLATPPGLVLDFIILILVSALLWAFMYVGKKYQVERWQGIIFLLLYVLYVLILFAKLKGI